MWADSIRPYGVGVRCLAARARDARADVTALGRGIDGSVYRLYGLSADEIAVVEEGAGKA